MALVSSTTAPLEAQYTAALGPPARPQPDAVLMMEPPPAAAMMGMTSAGHQKNGFYVHRHHPVPVGFAEFDDRGAANDAGVVEQDVDAAKFADRALDDALAVGGAGDVAGFEDGAAAVACDLGGDGVPG